MVPLCKEKSSASSTVSQFGSELGSDGDQRLASGGAGGSREIWSLAPPQMSVTWSGPQYGGFDIEPSSGGLLLQQACRRGDLDAVISLRSTASLVEAALHALPIAANAGHINVVREILSWPLPDKEPLLIRVIASATKARKAEMVRYLVQNALENGYRRPVQLEALFKAVTSVGDEELFYTLADRVANDIDWQRILFIAAEGKHWPLAVFAWQRCKDRDLEETLSDSQISQFQQEVGRQKSARDAQELRAASSFNTMILAQQRVRRI